MLPPVGVVIAGALMAAPTHYVIGLKVTAGAIGTAFTVRVTMVTGPTQVLLFVSVTNTVVVFVATLLNPS